MGKDSDSLGFRRTFLKSTIAGTAIGISGCLRFISGNSEDSNSTQTPTENETPVPTAESASTETPVETVTSTPTQTPVPIPQDTRFEFEYVQGEVTVRYVGDSEIPADHLLFRSSDGTQVRWPKLGSTAVPASGTVTKGDTATIGASVLNWPTDINSTDTIRVIFTTDGSPTTLATFDPSAERTVTAPDTETPTPTPEFGFTEDFEDGDYSDTFEISRQQSDTSIEVNDERPKNGDRSLNIRVGDTGEGDIALRNEIGDVPMPVTYSAWIYPNSTNHNIHFNFKGEEGSADISFNAAQHIVYRTDRDLDADTVDTFGNPILKENPDVNKWYNVSIRVFPADSEVAFKAVDEDENSWETDWLPATVDFTAVRLGGTDFKGNYEFYADDIRLTS